MHPIVSAIVEQLANELSTAITASQQAHSSATHSENVSSNRYDTLALEAAYLAHGQSVRIAELQESIALYKRFKRPEFSSNVPIELGALVTIENDSGDIRQLFIGPAAGGLSIGEKSEMIQVITTATPLGKALLNKTTDDEFELNIEQKSQYFTVIDIR